MSLGLGAVVVALLVLLVIQGRDRLGRTLRDGILLLGQGVLYPFEVLIGVALTGEPEDVGALVTRTIVILFALGVARVWEFVGADNPSLLGTLAGVSQGRERREGDGPDRGER